MDVVVKEQTKTCSIFLRIKSRAGYTGLCRQKHQAWLKGFINLILITTLEQHHLNHVGFYKGRLDYWVVLRNRAQQAKKCLLPNKKKVIKGHGHWEIKQNAFSIKCLYGSDCMCIRKIVYLHSPHVLLSKCLSVSLPARAHGSAWRPAERIEDGEKQKAKKKKKVLSVSAAWAGSWWEREGGSLAGRSHALFRHHSDGARPLGQNTTWFWITRTHKLENHTHLP